MNDLALALHLADCADEITMRDFGSTPSWGAKPDGSIVSEVDVRIDQAIREILRIHRPSDAILSEELGASEPGQRTWIVDPLDQTSNYVRGLSEFATLIALTRQERVVAGVISAPALGHRWWSVDGCGAWRDGEPIRVSEVRSISEALVSVAAPHVWRHRGRLAVVIDVLEAGRSAHASGGFLAQMLVAEGRLDIALDPWGEAWDLAAASLIVREAGGKFTDLAGKEDIYAGSGVATNGYLHPEVLRALAGTGD